MLEYIHKLATSPVRAGDQNSFSFTTGGQVYACGFNDYGDLGLGDTEHRNQPFRVLTKEPVLTASTGCNYSLFLTTSKRILAGPMAVDG